MGSDYLHQLLHPQLSLSTQSFIRSGYGMLLLGTLFMLIPHAGRFFISEKWKGYVESDPKLELIQNPFLMPVVFSLWMAAAVLLITGQFTLPAAFINLILCRYFFIHMRWKGLARGLGAPGFMSYWLGACIFCLEFCLHLAPAARDLAVCVFQMDFAFIMLSAGLYKSFAGYAQNEGMDYGMVNPSWGYFPAFFAKMKPSSLLFKTLNHLAWSMEVLAAFLMFIPETRWWGGFIIFGSFVFIATQIRLNLLCHIVMLCCFLFVSQGDTTDRLIMQTLPTCVFQMPPVVAAPELELVCQFAFGTYLILMPLAHAGLYFNFFGKKRLPEPLQTALEKFTNFFGIIIWRVFTSNLTNFFVNIYFVQQGKAGGKRIVSDYGWTGSRYRHVCESITVTSIFTTLKYYPSNSSLFKDKLIRYARTLNCPENCLVEFEYISIQKKNDAFEYVPKAVYLVDCKTGEIQETLLDETFSVHAANSLAPLHESSRPGSYAPPAQTVAQSAKPILSKRGENQ